MEERVINNLHNNPPEIEVIIAQEMAEQYREEIGLFNSYLEREKDLPAEINSDEESGKYSDYIKKLGSGWKMLDAARKTEKEVYSVKANAVHAFFKKKLDVIDEVRKRVDVPLAAYLKKKDDEKRRAAEEKAREAAEEAARKLKAAEEAARIAEEARRKQQEEAERIQREADAARLKAEQEATAAREKAEAEAAAIRKAAEDARIAAEAEAKRIADENLKRAEKEEISKRELQAQLRAAEEATKEAQRAAKEAERHAKEMIDEAERKAKEIARDARAVQSDADEKMKQLSKDAKDAHRESNRALDEAVRTDKAALKLERTANGSVADLSRTRGDASMASLSEYWIGEVENRASLDLETLREHLPMDALSSAVQSFVNAGGRQLRGAIITQEIRSVVR